MQRPCHSCNDFASSAVSVSKLAYFPNTRRPTASSRRRAERKPSSQQQRTGLESYNREPPARPVSGKCWHTSSCSAARRAHSNSYSQRTSRTSTRVLQDASLGETEPFKQPLAVCKQWLLRIFPILRNKELLTRLAWSMMVIALCRLGLHLKLPFVVRPVRSMNDVMQGGASEWLFLGGQNLPDSMFNLGVSPIINAGILVSLMTTAGPVVLGQKWAAYIDSLKESGQEGQAVLQGYVNKSGAIIALISGVSEAFRLAPYAKMPPEVPFIFLMAAILGAGSTTLRWLGDSVEVQGLGDGITLLIAINIVSGWGSVLKRVAAYLVMEKLAGVVAIVLGGVYLLLVVMAVFINDISLRLPLVYYKQRRSKAPQESVDKRRAASEALGTAELAPNNNYLPIALSPNGMSAILYASFLYTLPLLIGLVSPAVGIAMSMTLLYSKWSPVIYGVAVFFFGLVQIGGKTWKDMADYLNGIEAGIEGVSPGPSTEQFLKRKMAILRFWGALLVGILATAAHWFDGVCLRLFGQSVSSVSLLLLVGFITGLIRQVQALMQIPALDRAMNRERSVLEQIAKPAYVPGT